ncbi:hypothetical protein ACP70R_020814 [Stipagrostis hirtigluma subsp. patula]
MELDGNPKTGPNVVEMLGRLKLTAEESEAIVVEDAELEGLATSELAIIGKVLSASVLHIHTITAALRPAWGNPKGLVMKSVGNNVFTAEFECKQDLDRVLDGSPWNVGKKAVLVQAFDPNLRPSEVVFDRMSIWVRIYDLPFGLTNNKWGKELAKKIGSVVKIEVGSDDRAWGAYLRAKVQVDISKPLLRCISIYSERKKITEVFDVKYEKLPNYCYSCGLIGHSSVECSTPAERDEKGHLPYGKELRVQEESRFKKGTEEKQASSAGRRLNSGEKGGSSEGKFGQKGTDSKGKTGGSSNAMYNSKTDHVDEAISPRKKPARKGKKKADELEVKSVGKVLFPTKQRSQGTKRKQKSPKQNEPAAMLEGDQEEMPLVVVGQNQKF